MKPSFHSTMLVTHKQNRTIEEYLKFIAHWVNTGITSVQLREKNHSVEQLLPFANALKKSLSRGNGTVPLIINDTLELALQSQADGLHLGQDDGDIRYARKQLGADKILGLSVSSEEELILANELPLDYIGIGAIFATQNKQDVSAVLGVEKLAFLCQYSRHPVIAIGGIDSNNAHLLHKTGIRGIAAIGAFHQELTAEACKKVIHNFANTVQC